MDYQQIARKDIDNMIAGMAKQQQGKFLLLALLACSLAKVRHAFMPSTTNSHRSRMTTTTIASARDALKLANNKRRSPRGLDTTLFVASPKEQQNKNNNKEADAVDKEEGTAAPPRFTPPEPRDDEEWAGTVRGTRFRKLKDMVWIRETVEDLTAAEFACSVELASMQQDDEDNNDGDVDGGRKRRRRAVDYDKLLAQLNKRLRDMGCLVNDSDSDSVVCDLDSGIGMGTTVYDEGQRKELYEKIIETRDKLISVVRGSKMQLEKEEDSLPFKLNKLKDNLPTIKIQKEDNVTLAAGPKLYVRDDGTVDWEGALQDRAALQKFGSAVWSRINGQNPLALDDDENGEGAAGGGGHGGEKAVTAKIEDTPQIVEARKTLTELEKALRSAEVAHTKLLSSALSEGQAVANVNLASLAPSLRNEIRESADELDNKRQEVSYKTLVYELERIYTYLVGEMGNPSNKGYVPLQDRLSVAEFGLLESQLDSFTREIQMGENVDADVLVVVGDQVTDLKRRLGIDFYVTGVTFDAEAIKRLLAELIKQAKNGAAFYGRGCQLLWNDLVFCAFLIGRAAQGYTLKPREVRNLRRTTKDFFTFIPFVIILIIPITPIGHVLVFGAIQRFFPDFFPSCFTEQRQNLLQLYETAEYSEFKISESFQQKMSRLALASGYLIGTTSKGVFVRISQLLQSETENIMNSIDEDRPEKK